MSCNTYSARFGMDRTYSVNMVGQFDERVAYRDRVALFTSYGSLPDSFIVAPAQNDEHEAMVRKGFPLRFCQEPFTYDIYKFPGC